jgi:hypothetical protein
LKAHGRCNKLHRIHQAPAGEIAGLTWDMVLDPTAEVGQAIELHDCIAKKNSGRVDGRYRAGHPIPAWRRHVAGQHRQLVRPRLSRRRSYRLLVPFRPPHVHHPSRPVRSQSGRLIARCAATRRSQVDLDHPAVHRRRLRRAAQARRDDLNSDGRKRDQSIRPEPAAGKERCGTHPLSEPDPAGLPFGRHRRVHRRVRSWARRERPEESYPQPEYSGPGSTGWSPP